MISRYSLLLKYVAFVILPLIGIQCTKTDEEVLFKMEYDQYIAVPAGLNTIETYSFILKDLATNYKTLLGTFNVSDSTIKSIKPGSIRLVDELNQLDFSKIEKISLLVSKPNFQTELEIGYLETVPLTSTNVLQLFPTLVNAKDILSGTTFNLKLKVKLRNFLTSSTNIRLRFTLNTFQ
ncbi:MAG: hypothetical protein ABIR66_07790 [Saprospiraceae bacterium]